jgi:hypothetical protein
MHVRFFTMRMHGGEGAADELNRFLANLRRLADREWRHRRVKPWW